MSQQAKAYPQASWYRADGYKEVSLGRSIREKEIYQKPRVYPQASCDKAEGYTKKLKLYPKRKIKRKGDTPKEPSVSPSKLGQGGGIPQEAKVVSQEED